MVDREVIRTQTCYLAPGTCAVENFSNPRDKLRSVHPGLSNLKLWGHTANQNDPTLRNIGTMLTLCAADMQSTPAPSRYEVGVRLPSQVCQKPKRVLRQY